MTTTTPEAGSTGPGGLGTARVRVVEATPPLRNWRR